MKLLSKHKSSLDMKPENLDQSCPVAFIQGLHTFVIYFPLAFPASGILIFVSVAKSWSLFLNLFSD